MDFYKIWAGKRMRTNYFKSRYFILTVLVDIILIFAIFFLMSYVQYLLKEDARINLTEIVTQNKDVITSKISMELNNLELDANQLSDRFTHVWDSDWETQKKTFMEFVEKRGDTTLVWARSDGRAVGCDGLEFEISGRTYFRLGMEGTANISDRLISRVNGEDTFVVCVPLIYNNKVMGTIQKQYTPEAMYNLCSLSLFSDKGSTYIINSDGYILICSEGNQYNRESDNYYRILFLSDAETSKRLNEDIKSEKAGFMETTINDEKVFFAYTPIEEIHNWYLISSISTSAVSPNANYVVKLFYIILFVMTLLFSFSMFFYWAMKRKQQSSLEHIAFVDDVTGGDSYTRFMVDFHQIIRENPQQTFYICAFDIDNFKYINSFYGFEKGDCILKALYKCCHGKLTTNERLARNNSDHFVMLLEDCSIERLQDLIGGEREFGDIKVYLSAGLYHVEDNMESISLMVDKARIASQKTKGMHFKNVELYSEEYDKITTHNEQLKRALEKALENKEIVPFFQPKVDINTRKLLGAEALARWKTKDGKLISPAEFIPVCEKTGLITLVDMAIFEKTLEFIKSNLVNGVECTPISVNFSRMHLLNDKFIETFLNKLDEYRVPHELIEIEITETVIFNNHETICKFINELHKHGLHISMDDFGSGYSSLHMLKDVEIDVLKIDGGFLIGSSSNERQRAIFGTIIEMAKKLQIKVVVEGVETIEDVKLMKEFGASCAQGYYYARPMDIDRFTDIYGEGCL